MAGLRADRRSLRVVLAAALYVRRDLLGEVVVLLDHDRLCPAIDVEVGEEVLLLFDASDLRQLPKV